MPNLDDAKEKPQIRPPYAGRGDTLILRDALAIDRTRLANERTLLAWLRTGLMLLVSGVTLIKLFEDRPLLEMTGDALIPCGLLAAVLGLHRFLYTKAQIETSLQD